MGKSLIESWQEPSKSFAGLFKNISDKNVAVTQALCRNLASKQWSKMTRAAFDMTKEFGAAGNKSLNLPAVSFPLPSPSDSDIQSIKDLNEIYHAALVKICDSQFAMSKSYLDLWSNYSENLEKSRDIDDVVATNFDYLGNLMEAVKNGALDSLAAGDSIKTALVAWSENSLEFPGDYRPSSTH